MENMLMRFCRENHRQTLDSIATQLHVSVDEYLKIENGEILLNFEQADRLGQLYKADSSLFYEAAMQLDLLLTRIEIIKVLQWEKNVLVTSLKKGRIAASA